MGQTSENLYLGVDGGKEGAELPWRFRWHLGRRQSWSPAFSAPKMRGLAQALLAGQALEPYVRRELPAIGEWLDKYSQAPEPAVRAWDLLRPTVSRLLEPGR